MPGIPRGEGHMYGFHRVLALVVKSSKVDYKYGTPNWKGNIILVNSPLFNHTLFFHVEKNIFSFIFTGEVRSLYRAFKQECPNGIVDEETFKNVYEKIFPLGDASQYAHLVFQAIDRYVKTREKIRFKYLKYDCPNIF